MAFLCSIRPTIGINFQLSSSGEKLDDFSLLFCLLGSVQHVQRLLKNETNGNSFQTPHPLKRHKSQPLGDVDDK